MVFEYADGGTLFEHLQKYFPNLIWNDKYKLGVEITEGLMYLHSLEIVHKDLVCIIIWMISVILVYNCHCTLIWHISITVLYEISPHQIFLSKEVLQKYLALDCPLPLNKLCLHQKVKEVWHTLTHYLLKISLS